VGALWSVFSNARQVRGHEGPLFVGNVAWGYGFLFAATKALMTETFGLAPAMEAEGVVLFIMTNGTMLELHEPQTVPDYGFNEGGVVFGFRVDHVETAGCELLGQITRVEEMAFAYRHFRGPDGRVYGLNEQK
jgi:hypothetical protein